MVQINFGQREVSCKIVFYGPGMSGKTTNLEIIHQKAPKQAVGEMVSIATETDRTLYFDFMPMDLGQVAGMHTKFMLYTVPGQIYYNATRKLVLQGVDGVIFVADSSPDKMAENLESFQNLRDNLAEMGLAVEDLPLVLQYNKRDLPGAMSVSDMNAQMNPLGAPTFEACARDGKGVFATLKEVSRLVIEKLNRDHAPAANRRRTASSLTPVGGTAQAAPSGAQQQAPPRPAPPAPAPVAAPPRPAALPPAPPMGTSGSRPAPRGTSGARPASGGRPAAPPPAPPAAAPQRAAAAAPQRGAPAPRDRHLAKAAPQPLASRPQANVSLGATDPNLKRYQEQSKSGGKLFLWLIITVLLVGIILVVSAVFLPPVRQFLPEAWQARILAFLDPPKAAESAPLNPTPAPPVAPQVVVPAQPVPPTPAPVAPPTAAVPAPGAQPAPAVPEAAAPATDAPAPVPAVEGSGNGQ